VKVLENHHQFHSKKPLSQELKAKGMTIEEIRQKERARKLQHFDHG